MKSPIDLAIPLAYRPYKASMELKDVVAGVVSLGVLAFGGAVLDKVQDALNTAPSAQV